MKRHEASRIKGLGQAPAVRDRNDVIVAAVHDDCARPEAGDVQAVV